MKSDQPSIQMTRLLPLWLPLLLLTWSSVVMGFQVRLEEILNLKEYDGSLRPQMRQGPTLVNVSFIMDTLLIVDSMQVLEISGDLLQEWEDPNLLFPGSSGGIITSVGLSGTTGSKIQDQIWRPDLTAAHNINPRGSIPHSDFLRITRDGRMSYNQRVHYTIPCIMELYSYPLGVHTCTLKLNSLGYDSSELQPSWYGDTAVEFANLMITHGYELTEVKTSAKTVVTAHKPKRQLRVEMELQAYGGWEVKHTVIPMIATVTTAYFSFFINIRGACVRVILGMMSLMTAAIFHESTYRSVPHASYTMAIEVFTGTCLSFIFIATVESVVVDVLSHLPVKGRRSAPSSHTSFALEVRDEKPDLTEERVGMRGNVAALWLDRCFRVLYPASFIAFNAVYWVLYN
ncbi:glycine receptor subunit alpha-2 isoform X1 [Cherax quadricarinatus]|uniref:glycine receptor subunit alpha-2 isoform X1 n=1 Tax=Cherax quadricarinatus TaxID=27406 RepID=UPI00387E45C9